MMTWIFLAGGALLVVATAFFYYAWLVTDGRLKRATEAAKAWKKAAEYAQEHWNKTLDHLGKTIKREQELVARLEQPTPDTAIIVYGASPTFTRVADGGVVIDLGMAKIKLEPVPAPGNQLKGQFRITTPDGMPVDERPWAPLN